MVCGPILITLLLFRRFDDAAVAASVRAACVPLKTVVASSGSADMEPLKKVLASVKVVGMGEPTHGSREVFQMKHRMFEFLASQMGYTVFAIEASMPDCVAIDRYVTTGEGNLSEVVQGQGFWTWSTQEVADFVAWMRAYNQDANHPNKLRVVGVDMQDRRGTQYFLSTELKKIGAKLQVIPLDTWDNPSQEQLDRMDLSVKEALPKIREKLGAEEAVLTERIQTVFHQALAEESYGKLVAWGVEVSAYAKETLNAAPPLIKSHPGLSGDALLGMQLLAKAMTSADPPKRDDAQNIMKYSIALRSYAGGRKDHQDFERGANVLELLSKALAVDPDEANYRDKCMAQNLEWVTTTYLPGQRVMLWAHNGHIQRSTAENGSATMGGFLDEFYKAQYYPIGFSFFEGSFQAMDSKGEDLRSWTVRGAPVGSLDFIFNLVRVPLFFIDFGSLDAGTQNWFDQPRSSRSIGALFDPAFASTYVTKDPPKKMFRGMIFIAKTTRARPIKQ